MKDNGNTPSIGTDARESSLHQRKRGKQAGNHVYKKSTICQKGVNKNNLVTINGKQNHKVQQMSKKSMIMLVNAQSMKNKEHALFQHIDDFNIDILGIIETWITSNDKDKVWKNSCCFNGDGWKAGFNTEREGQEVVRVWFIEATLKSIGLRRGKNHMNFVYGGLPIKCLTPYYTYLSPTSTLDPPS